MRPIGWLLLFGLWPFWLGAQPPGPERMLAYGEHLYGQGEYYRAISEFKRLSFRYPQSAPAQKAQVMIARAYLAGGQPDQAAAFLKQRLAEQPEVDQYWLLYGLAQLDQGRNEPFSLREARVGSAMEAFVKVSESHEQAPLLQDFVQQWQAAPSEPVYSPGIAGGLSAVLPGSGSLYVGRWREGAYAFLLTGLFALASKEAYQGGQPALGAVLGGFGLAFYGGNVYVAVNSAHKLNDQARSEELQRLRRKHGLFFIPPGAGVAPRF